MVDIYYNSMRYKNSLKYVEEKFKTPYEMYYELSIYAETNGYFERKISAEEWFDVLARFYIEKGFRDYLIFREKLSAEDPRRQQGIGRETQSTRHALKGVLPVHHL